jgi:hypothetical protein
MTAGDMQFVLGHVGWSLAQQYYTQIAMRNAYQMPITKRLYHVEQAILNDIYVDDRRFVRAGVRIVLRQMVAQKDPVGNIIWGDPDREHEDTQNWSILWKAGDPTYPVRVMSISDEGNKWITAATHNQ